MSRRTRRLRGLVLLWVGVAAVSCATVGEPEVVRSPSAGSEESVSLDTPPGRRLKRKIIIARFSNETTYGKSVLLGDRSNRVARQASDMLAARLVESGRFLLFERTDTAKILEALDDSSLTGLGLPADTLIVGSLSEFGRRETSDTGVFSRTKKQTTVARVNVRLVDVATSRVFYATEGAGEAESEVGTVLGIGTKAGYDSSLNDAAISAAVSKLVNQLMENLLGRPWRSYVLAAEDGVITIGGGESQGVEVGDRFRLVERGRSVKNPQTGGLVELPGKELGTIEVVGLFGRDPADEIAQCKLVDGAFPEGDLAALVVEEIAGEDGK